MRSCPSRTACSPMAPTRRPPRISCAGPWTRSSSARGSSRATALAAPAHGSIRSGRLGALVQRESVFSWLMLTPPVLFLLAFLGYPFFYGVYLSFFRREVAGSASFVGLGNFVILGNDPIFWQAVRNTVLFTAVATVLKASGGLGMALLMNQSFRMKALTPASLLLPVIFIVTTFSIILTFFDFQLVYVLTGGGPANSTHLMATYAYSLSMGAGQMGLGSAVALSMVPVLGLLLVLLTLYVRKD